MINLFCYALLRKITNIWLLKVAAAAAAALWRRVFLVLIE